MIGEDLYIATNWPCSHRASDLYTMQSYNPIQNMIKFFIGDERIKDSILISLSIHRTSVSMFLSKIIELQFPMKHYSTVSCMNV